MGFISRFLNPLKKQSFKKSTKNNDSDNRSSPSREPALLPVLPNQDDGVHEFSLLIAKDDMSVFIQVQNTRNDINQYLHHFTESIEKEEYATTISSMSFQNALFSECSDTRSEVTHHSGPPMDDLYFFKKYQEAMTSANPLALFEDIAKHGAEHYKQLHPLVQELVSFAQYRAGRLLGPQGLPYLNEAAKHGNSDAIFLLGVYTEKCGDFELACDLYYQANNHIYATLAFSHLLLFQNVQHLRYTTQQAIDMLRNASEKGHSVASLALTLYYEMNHDLSMANKFASQYVSNGSTDFLGYYDVGVIFIKTGSAKKAFKSFTRAYELNCTYIPVLIKLGMLYRLGMGVAQDLNKALMMIQEAARLGGESANIMLAQCYHTGIGCRVDLSKAMAIYQTYPNNMAAQLSRGLLLKTKNPALAYQDFERVVNCVPTEYDKRHWRVASIQQEAAVLMAAWELNGWGGVERNPLKAIETLTRLSEECNYGGAHYYLGGAYMEGVQHVDGTVIIKPNQKKAFQCFLKGDQQPDCQYCLGKMLQDGFKHQEFSSNDALGFFLKAAEMGHYSACTQVGVYYYSGGPGTGGRDLNRAFQYFTVAAKKNNDPLAIQYLADYIIKKNAGDIDTQHVYEQLIHAAAIGNDPIAYRMLALVVHNGVDLDLTFDQQKMKVHTALDKLYSQAKQECIQHNQSIKFRFALHCLWKAIELKDHGSGQYLNQFLPMMTNGDQIKTIEVFESVESGVPNKMSVAYANFLKVANNKPEALGKFIETAMFNDMTTGTGWESRLEAAKLVLFDRVGKATSKVAIFTWLNKMIQYKNGKNLFTPYILLGKCHDMELCSGCDKDMAAELYENGLTQKLNDAYLEVFARARLIEIFYNQYQNGKHEKQMKAIEPLLDQLTKSLEKIPLIADVYYYKGLNLLHNASVPNHKEIARKTLIKAERLGHIMAALELAYLYGTMKSREDQAEKYFQKVEQNSKISFQNRLTEFMVQSRTQSIQSHSDYLQEIIKMKLAAGITYSYYQMERQAFDWFQEVSDHPLAQIMILYYKMKDVRCRDPESIQLLVDAMNSFETQPLDYYGSISLSYGQYRLGQCYELGHGVSVNQQKALDYYIKAAAYLQNADIYERLVEISDKSSVSDTVLFRTLCHASRNDPDAMFKLAQYYHVKKPCPDDPDIPSEKASAYYLKAAKAGHSISCYYYAKYEIFIKRQTEYLNAAAKSKKAADFLYRSASKNHGPSYFELGQLKIAIGLYKDGVDDLKEAAFLQVGAACYRLGELYEVGFIGICSSKEIYRILPSLETALTYYQNALKHEYLPAIIKIGKFFEQGWVVTQDLTKARHYYMKGMKCPKGVAEYALGCLEESLAESLLATRREHYQQAFMWFQASLKAKNSSAKFKIGRYLLHNLVTVKDRESDSNDGVLILEEEKENCNVEAVKELAKYYHSKKLEAKAFQYWKHATLFDDPEAYEFIAECFEKGTLGQCANPKEASVYKLNAIEARKRAMEVQLSTIGFKSDYST